MNANGPVWCRENIDKLTEMVAANAVAQGHTIGVTAKLGISLIISAAINKDTGKGYTLLQKQAIKSAKKYFRACKEDEAS